MFKKILFLVITLSLMLTLLNTSKTDADNLSYSNKYIRVGLEKSLGAKSVVKLNGVGFRVAAENENADVLFDIQGDTVLAKAKTFSHHVEVKETFNSYGAANDMAISLRSLGEDAYVAYKNGFKVYIGVFTNEGSALKTLEKICGMGIDAFIQGNSVMVEFQRPSGESIVSFETTNRLAIKSNSETTLVEGKRFRGFLSFSPSSTSLKTVNFIKLDDYLRGVVPREMSGSWNIEALKAQAVSARNYTLRNINKHKTSGFDICDSTHCQVYEGFDKEHPNSNRAIDETVGKLLKYSGEIAQTFYYSSSGGYTSSNENVWGGAAISYLRGREDRFSLNVPNSEWTYSIKKTEAEKKFKANGFDVGSITSFKFKRDQFNARVVDLIVVGTKGEKTIPKEKIRNILGTSNVKSTNYIILGQEGNDIVPTPPVEKPTEVYVTDGENTYATDLKNKTLLTASSMIVLSENTENLVLSNGLESVVRKSIESYISSVEARRVGDTITFKGSGWGHGVGMSQYGALNMAKLGYNYAQILEFYYIGAYVE